MTIEELINRRYVHWTSGMREEMKLIIQIAEKGIEARFFDKLPPLVPGRLDLDD